SFGGHEESNGVLTEFTKVGLTLRCYILVIVSLKLPNCVEKKRKLQMGGQQKKIRKQEFKYPNPTPTNTEAFCDKISYLTDCACGNYKLGTISVLLEVDLQPRLSDNSTICTTGLENGCFVTQLFEIN
ncbi:hypothetical protein DVH24_013247, partial [Malus domestica]